jgi:hypothetical protein
VGLAGSAISEYWGAGVLGRFGFCVALAVAAISECGGALALRIAKGA